MLGINPNEDFAEANLSYYLSGAAFGGADMHCVNLSGANLSVADLSRADLNHAILSGADLTFTNLSRANGGAIPS